MNLLRRVLGRLGRDRARFVYEIMRPKLGAADVNARLDPVSGLDAAASEGFTAILRRQLSDSPPAPAWETGAEGIPDLDDVDWHVDPHFGARWPRRYERTIPDYISGSDHVLLWHKNKMMFLLDAAERYRSSGDDAHARACFQAIDSWCRQNPYMVGKNWRSPMEAGTRLVVWSYALSKLEGAGPPDEETCARIVRSMIRQAEWLGGHFSLKELPNNHLIGEAATLFVFATWWTIFQDAADWRAKAEGVLVDEVGRQILGDGFDYENSVNYHLYVIDFLLLYLHAKVVRDETPPAAVTDAAARMIDAALALISPAGRFPQIGDDSMTDFIALRRLGDVAPSGDVVRATDIVRPGFASAIGAAPWGRALMERGVEVQTTRYFAGAGIAVIRDADSHAVFTSGPQHGRPFSTGHLHLDGGGFELEVDGVPVFVDSGTYLYGYDTAARLHFKGASAHNTLLVDDREPVESEMVFGWETVHTARTLNFDRFDGGAMIACERRIPGTGGAEFVHRRHFIATDGLWAVIDDVSPAGGGAYDERHVATVLLHATVPRSTVVLLDARKLALEVPGSAKELYVDIYSDGDHDVEAIDDPDDMRCWYSRHYGDLRRGVTIGTSIPAESGCRLLHVIRRADVSARFDGWRGAAFGLTVLPDGPPRTFTLDLETSELRSD